MVSLFSLARARSWRACSSLYFGGAAGVGVGVAAALAVFVLVLVFVVVSVHAESPKLPSTITVHGKNLLFIFLSPKRALKRKTREIASITVCWRFPSLLFQLAMLSPRS